MSDAVRKAAIEPFFSTKEEGEGSGLGLSMVYGFVRQSGGHMRIESEPDQGTRVEIFLPRSAQPASGATHINGEAAVPGGPETVLVVDDNTHVRNSAVATLTKMGYDVLGASSGAEALEVLDSSEVALLFSDVRMPEMTGIELAARAQAAHPHLRVLLTSGFANGTAALSDDKQPYEFIPKPYRKHDLAIRIRNILDKRDYE